MQTIKRFSAALVCLAALALCGCSNPNAASDGNFRAAINRALAKHNPTLLPFGVQFPYKIPKENLYADRKQMDALVKVGLAHAEETTEDAPSYFNAPPKKQVYIVYTLTVAGNQAMGQTKSLLGSVSALTPGEAVVDHIDNFTQPQDMMGSKVSQVKYTYRLQNTTPWATDPDMQAAFPRLAEIVKAEKEPVEATMTLILTNNGWSDDL